MSTLDRQTAKAAIAFIGTGLGMTLPLQAEVFKPRPSAPQSATWDTLDSATWNTIERMRAIRKINRSKLILGYPGFDMTGGTGAIEPSLYAVTEAESNRFRDITCEREPAVAEVGSVARSENAGEISDLPGVLIDIRENLSLSITELSAILGVKRPTIYAWLRGDSRPHPRNSDRIALLFRVSRRWAELAGRPLKRQLRQAFDLGGKTLFSMLKDEDADFSVIEDRLISLAELPVPRKLHSMKALAKQHGLRTDAQPDAELIRDIETGRRLKDD